MKAQTFFAAYVCFTYPFLLVAQPRDHGESEAHATQPAISLSAENGALNADFRDQPLHAVAQILAQKAHVRLVLAKELVDDRVSLNVRSTAVDIALRTLLSSYDTFVFYAGSMNAPSALRTVWVYSKGGASDVYPVPRSDWAGIRELEATLKDENAAVRQEAYQALLERPDRRSRSLILDAIRGTTERDSSLRERLLSAAITKGFPLTPEVLTDLARADASEHIRWMALDALAFSDNPSARGVAEAAATDPSQIVRARALEMLNQLSANEKAQRLMQEFQ